MKQEIIIVGGNSFAGKTILPHLLSHYEKVHVVCRSKADFPPHSNLQIYVTDDLASDRIKQAIENCNAGLYFATATTPATSASNPLLELDQNVKPLVSFLDLIQHKRYFTLIYISSGGTIYGNAVSGPIKEHQPFSPRSYYAAGKIAGESFVHAFSRQTGNNTIILRPSNFYGVGQPYTQNFGLIRTVFERLVNNESITIWGDGENRRDFLYIEDFISACIFLLQRTHDEKVQTFNVSNGTSVSLNRVCDLIEKITGQRLARVYKPIRQIDVKNVELDSTKIRQLGWSPKISIERGLQLMWEWIRNNK